MKKRYSRFQGVFVILLIEISFLFKQSKAYILCVVKSVE